jgi:hypothetical protein
MMRNLTAAGVVSGVLLAASLAKADTKSGFGQQQGQFIVSADRLMPLFAYTSFSQDQTGALPPGVNKATATTVQTALSFFQGGTPGMSPETAIYTAPRIGFDYVVVPNITVGGNLVFYTTLGGHTTTEQSFNNGQSMSLSQGTPSTLIFGIAPRGGYVLPLSDMFSLWLRGGFSFYVANTKTPFGTGNTAGSITNNTNQFALDLDPQILFTPISHLGVTAGLTTDIPIAGGHSVTNAAVNASTTASAGSSIFYFGAELGLVGWF